MVYYYSSLWLDLVHLNYISTAPFGTVVFLASKYPITFREYPTPKISPTTDVIGEIAIYFLFFSGGFDCFTDFVCTLAVGG